jgi:Single-strand binding protein family
LPGNLVHDSELRFTNTGTAVANMRVAVTQRIQQDGEWRDGDTSFFKGNVWRGQAEHLADFLAKGDRVMVTGRLLPQHTQTLDLPITRRTLGVNLDGPRRIQPAHVGCLVGPDGSRRIQTDRLDDQMNDQGAYDKNRMARQAGDPPFKGQGFTHRQAAQLSACSAGDRAGALGGRFVVRFGPGVLSALQELGVFDFRM